MLILTEVIQLYPFEFRRSEKIRKRLRYFGGFKVKTAVALVYLVVATCYNLEITTYIN